MNVTCHCQRLSIPCTSPPTAEDLLCDVCRDLNPHAVFTPCRHEDQHPPLVPVGVHFAIDDWRFWP